MPTSVTRRREPHARSRTSEILSKLRYRLGHPRFIERDGFNDGPVHGRRKIVRKVTAS